MKKTQPLNNGLTPKEMEALRDAWRRIIAKEAPPQHTPHINDEDWDGDDTRWKAHHRGR